MQRNATQRITHRHVTGACSRPRRPWRPPCPRSRTTSTRPPWGQCRPSSTPRHRRQTSGAQGHRRRAAHEQQSASGSAVEPGGQSGQRRRVITQEKTYNTRIHQTTQGGGGSSSVVELSQRCIQQHRAHARALVTHAPAPPHHAPISPREPHAQQPKMHVVQQTALQQRKQKGCVSNFKVLQSRPESDGQQQHQHTHDTWSQLRCCRTQKESDTGPVSATVTQSGVKILFYERRGSVLQHTLQRRHNPRRNCSQPGTIPLFQDCKMGYQRKTTQLAGLWSRAGQAVFTPTSVPHPPPAPSPPTARSASCHASHMADVHCCGGAGVVCVWLGAETDHWRSSGSAKHHGLLQRRKPQGLWLHGHQPGMSFCHTCV